MQALDHPKFREMIDIASRAKDGVTVPGRKLIREEIIEMFKKQLDSLRKEMNVRRLSVNVFLSIEHLLLYVTRVTLSRVR